MIVESAQKLPSFLNRNSSEINGEFKKLLSLLYNMTPLDPLSEGLKKENSCKNRYLDVIANDNTRVKLEGKEQDYINANHCLKNTVILSQGPLRIGAKDYFDHHADFYHMLWTNNCSAIAMVTDFIENYQEKCSFYLPEENQTKIAGQYSITSEPDTTNGNLIELNIKTTKIFIEYQGEKRTLVHYQMPTWLDGEGTSAKAVAVLTRILLQEKKPLIHCSAGIGRSGTLAAAMGAYNAYRERATSDTLIFDVVQELRTERRGCVQTREQYKTLYEAVKILITEDLNIEVEPKADPFLISFNQLSLLVEPIEESEEEKVEDLVPTEDPKDDLDPNLNLLAGSSTDPSND